MKKLFFSVLLLSVFSPAVLLAQNTVTIHQKDGRKVSYGFSVKPVITYTDNDLVITTENAEMQYPLLSVSKITFQDQSAGVNAITEESKVPVLELDDYVVSISGAKAGVTVSLTGTDGKTLINARTDSEGEVSFSIAEQPAGVYVIKSENLTFKIIRK
jgi:hypothetical protein